MHVGLQDHTLLMVASRVKGILRSVCLSGALLANLIVAAPWVYSASASSIAIPMIRAEEEQINITIDGRLDEAIWKTIPAEDNMVVVEPDTLANTELQTKRYFFYTDKGFYAGVFAEQPPDTFVGRLSPRDRFINRDGISIALDPSGKGLYGYWFSVNLGGTLQDGTVIPERQFSNQWDGHWYGAASVQEDGWMAEMFIPWSLMSMPESDGGVREMGYYISRFLAHKNERWGFPGLPRTGNVFLSQLQPIALQDVNPKQQFMFYPYAASTYDNAAADHRDAYKAGFDLFWRPSSNLQVSATVNPDFGNVESDKVVVNLTAFETFFSEKRAFFLEGQEIFVTSPRAKLYPGQKGEPLTLVNTRRIGSAPVSPDTDDFEADDVTANQPSKLIAAVKTTGQRGKLRYGLLIASEGDTRLAGKINGTSADFMQHGRDFGIVRLLYEDSDRRARRSVGLITTQVQHPSGNASVYGMDAHYLAKNGRWGADGQLLYSDIAGRSGRGGFVDFIYSPFRGRKHKLSLDYFDDKLNINDLGFLRRNDHIGLRYAYTHDESGLPRLKTRSSKLQLVQEYNTRGRLVRSGIFLTQKRGFQNNHSLHIQLNYFPNRWDDRSSDGNGDYTIEDRWNPGFSYETDKSMAISARAGVFYQGGDIGGRSVTYKFGINWRPGDHFSLLAAIHYEDRTGWLLHSANQAFTTYDAEFWRPKFEMDIFLSARQQFRITAQWVGIKAFEERRLLIPAGGGDFMDDSAIHSGRRDFSISRLTFQARYKWELAPLSDLFVVYTRASDVPSMTDAGFEDLLGSAWTDSLVDVFVIKLRYRLGS